MSVKAFEILPCVDNLMPTIISAGRKKRLETEVYKLLNAIYISSGIYYLIWYIKVHIILYIQIQY